MEYQYSCIQFWVIANTLAHPELTIWDVTAYIPNRFADEDKPAFIDWINGKYHYHIFLTDKDKSNIMTRIIWPPDDQDCDLAFVKKFPVFFGPFHEYYDAPLLSPKMVVEDVDIYSLAIDRIAERLKPYCGFSIPRGWYPIVFELDQRLREIDPDYYLSQAKEKFGTLRYYANPSSGEVDSEKFYNIVDEYEAATEAICQNCGEPAKLRTIRGWDVVLCDGCLESKK